MQKTILDFSAAEAISSDETPGAEDPPISRFIVEDESEPGYLTRALTCNAKRAGVSSKIPNAMPALVER